MNHDTKVNLSRRLEKAEALEKLMESLRDSMQKLKFLVDTGHAVNIQVTAAVSEESVTLQASTSSLDCLTPVELKDTINSLHHTLVAKYSEVKAQYDEL